MIGILNGERGGGLDLEFPHGMDKSKFLENAYFMDVISSTIIHELTSLLTTAGVEDTRQASINLAMWAVHNTPEPLKIQNILFLSCKNSL